MNVIEFPRQQRKLAEDDLRPVNHLPKLVSLMARQTGKVTYNCGPHWVTVRRISGEPKLLLVEAA